MLTDLQRSVLDFERASGLLDQPKDVAIRDQLGMEPGRYYRLLLAAIEDADALRYDPETVRRVRNRLVARRRPPGPAGPDRAGPDRGGDDHGGLEGRRGRTDR